MFTDASPNSLFTAAATSCSKRDISFEAAVASPAKILFAQVIYDGVVLFLREEPSALVVVTLPEFDDAVSFASARFLALGK